MSACLVAMLIATSAIAQEASNSEIPDYITLDMSYVISESDIGKEIYNRYEEITDQIIADNELIDAELKAEEAELVKKRETTDPEKFKKLAVAFDLKSENYRAETDAKIAELPRTRNVWIQRLRNQILLNSSNWAQRNGVKMIMLKENLAWADPRLDLSGPILSNLNEAYAANKAQVDAIIFAPIVSADENQAADNNIKTETTGE